MRFKKLIAQQL